MPLKGTVEVNSAYLHFKSYYSIDYLPLCLAFDTSIFFAAGQHQTYRGIKGNYVMYISLPFQGLILVSIPVRYKFKLIFTPWDFHYEFHC